MTYIGRNSSEGVYYTKEVTPPWRAYPGKKEQKRISGPKIRTKPTEGKLKCYGCRSDSHETENCPLRGKCYKCHLRGHRISECKNEAFDPKKGVVQPRPAAKAYPKKKVNTASAAVANSSEDVNPADDEQK